MSILSRSSPRPPHLPVADARVVATPAATMRTYASPTTAVPAPFAVWRTEMAAGTAGPLHVVDVDQVVVVVSGQLHAAVDGREMVVPAGDSALLPAGVERRLAAGPEGLVTGDRVPAGRDGADRGGRPRRRAVGPMTDDVPLVRLLSMAVTVALESLHESLARAGHPHPPPGARLRAARHLDRSWTRASPSSLRCSGPTKQGAAELLQALADEDYVEVATAGGDARRRPVSLTPRGRAAVDDLRGHPALTSSSAGRRSSAPQRMQALRSSLGQAVLVQVGAGPHAAGGGRPGRTVRPGRRAGQRRQKSKRSRPGRKPAASTTSTARSNCCPTGAAGGRRCRS